MGAYSRRELERFDEQDVVLLSIFHGHPAGNIDLLTGGLARLPGTDPGLFERDYFGLEPSDRTPVATRGRLPVIIPKLIVAQAKHAGRLRALAQDAQRRWREAVTGPATPERLRRLAHDTIPHFEHAMAVHAFQTAMAQRAYGKVANLATKYGHAGLETRLVSGSGVLEELAVARDLWTLSRGDLSIDQFLERHGYHGPDEGELSVRSWREDPTPVLGAAAAFKDKPDGDSPDHHLARQQRDQQDALAAFLASVPASRRPMARAAVRSAMKVVPRREVGKAAFLKVLDVGRFALRGLGEELAVAGTLDEPDDIFHLTIPEAVAERGIEDLRPLVKDRRARREEYLELDLPAHWVGDPAPVRAGTGPMSDGLVTGIGACQGTVEGTARVVLDPSRCEPLRPDQILVARTTDPGWVSLFMDACGMVVDIGGPLSHAAIVARELGIPCVINTVDGSRRIPDGARLRMDGAAGTVEILAT
jgi:pyruvate,water dikinase